MSLNSNTLTYEQLLYYLLIWISEIKFNCIIAYVMFYRNCEGGGKYPHSSMDIYWSLSWSNIKQHQPKAIIRKRNLGTVRWGFKFSQFCKVFDKPK